MKYEITAKRLKEALADCGLSQQELADKSGIGKSSISHYINGANKPLNKAAYAMGNVLGVNPAWLMGLEGSKEPLIPFIKTEQGKLNESETLLLTYYRKLNGIGKKETLRYMKYLCSQEEYIKDTSLNESDKVG